jgi:hypothetical protein
MPFEMGVLQSVELGEFGLDGDFHLDALSIHILNLHRIQISEDQLGMGIVRREIVHRER